MLSRRMLFATALVAIGSGLTPVSANAQNYRDHPITLVVPYAAGGGPTRSPA